VQRFRYVASNRIEVLYGLLALGAQLSARILSRANCRADRIRRA
jgi:hypothetical protein